MDGHDEGPSAKRARSEDLGCSSIALLELAAAATVAAAPLAAHDDALRPAGDDDQRHFTGVYWDKARRKWKAQINIEAKLHSLGRYVDKFEAARAYDRRARELGRGVNFPRAGEVRARNTEHLGCKRRANGRPHASTRHVVSC